MSLSPLQAFLDSIEARMAAVEAALNISPPAGGAALKTAAAAGPTAPFVTAFDNHMMLALDPFLAAAKALGGSAAELGDIVKRSWTAQHDFIVMASKCKKPEAAAIMAKLAPIKACMDAANAAVKRDDWENHAKAVKEGLACLNWVTVAPPSGLPEAIVESAVGGSDYWANKVRVQHKKTGPEHVAFCDTFKALLLSLQEYVATYHKTGVEWNNAKGIPVADYKDGGAAPAAAAAAAAAPAAAAAAAPKPEGDRNNMFAALSKGLDVTKGLKKVTKDQQTWRAEYKGSDAPPPPAPAAPAAKKPAAATAAAAGAAAASKGPPRVEFQRQGLKWVVEYQTKEQGLVTVTASDIKQQVYIFGCVDATIDVKGKCKSIVLDGCKKTRLLMDSALASVETVNCQRMQVQIRGSVPSVAIDKTDGFLCYLSKEGLETKFTTSKSSEMNVAFPKPGAADDADLIEMPIPEQFVHTVQLEPTPTITSNVSELYTH